LFFIFFGTGLEALTLMQIDNDVWVMTLYGLVVGCGSSGGAL
jgi:hypothetical protein